MRNYRLLLLFCPLLAFCQQAEQSLAPLQTVDRVEIERYAGLWYEIARLPNRFQRNCNSNTTAEYRLRDDGRIDVINSCRRQDGSTNEAQAIARIVDKQSNAKLQVSFVRFLGISLFWGDYWIIGLDADYRYVVVGTPSRKLAGFWRAKQNSMQGDRRRSTACCNSTAMIQNCLSKLLILYLAHQKRKKKNCVKIQSSNGLAEDRPMIRITGENGYF